MGIAGVGGSLDAFHMPLSPAAEGGTRVRLSFTDLWFDAKGPLAGDALRGYVGKTLRGALGFALKRTACHDSRASCDACLLHEHCAYAIIFEGVPPAARQVMKKYPRIPQPFVLLLPGAKDARSARTDLLCFGVRLIGQASRAYPYVIQAVRSMCERGLGRERTPFVLERVSDGRDVVYEASSSVLRPPSARRLDLCSDVPSDVRRIHIKFRTPVCLCADGRRAVLPTLEEVLRAAVRRTRLLATFYGEGEVAEVPKALLDAARASRGTWRSVRWHDIPRYSARQGRGMVLRGVTGHAVFDWPADVASPGAWLEAAKTFHIGKAVTFGFGGLDYRLESL